MSITIQKLTGESIDPFLELIRVFEMAFDMKDVSLPPTAYLQRVLDQDSFWVFVAQSDGQVVGGLTAYLLPQYYSQQPLVYLYDLAVSPRHQRQGIGRQLLADLTSFARSQGVDEVFVQADGDDTKALEFYRATGGRAEEVVHFTYALTNNLR